MTSRFRLVRSRLEGLLQDLSFAVRQLRKNPGFVCTATLVLALGMAASISIFAFVDAALLQPLPYRDPARLVGVYETSGSCRDCGVSYEDYLDWKKDNTVFQSLEAWEPSVFLWRSPAGVQAVRNARVSAGFFRTLGVSPMLGRGFTEEDDMPSAPRTVLLTYGAWQNRFGGQVDVVGQTLVLDNLPYTVIGVLPREFHFAPRAAEFWATIHDPISCEKPRACDDVYGLARLKDGVSVRAALADMQAIAARLEEQYPDSNKGRGALVMPLRDAIVGDIRPTLLLLLSGAVLLMLIAFVNVASLVLVRAENRRREMALRGALGASPGRLLRLFVAEGVVLASLAVSFGLAAANEAIPWLFRLIPERNLRGLPYFRDAGLHSRVLLFAGVASLIATAIFSLTPVLRLSVSNLRDELAKGGRGSPGTAWKRFSSNLVAAELAIAVVLLAGAGLLGKSLYHLLHVDLNFDPARVATFEIDTGPEGYKTEEGRIALSRRLREGLSSLPGVVATANTNELPVTCNCYPTSFRVPGQPWYGDRKEVLQRETSADYFRVLGARLLRGRFYTEADDASKPRVAVINRSMAREYFPGEDPVGRTIGDSDLSPKSLLQVVGVVDDIREGELTAEIRPAVYRPFNQDPDHSIFLTVRTAPDPAPMIPVLEAAIHRIDPALGVRNEFTMQQHIDNSGTAFLNRSSAWLVGAFALSALLLAVIGLYGTIAYSVSRRTREIGVRMALGAQRGAVYRLILGEAGLVAAAGIVVGIGASIASAALIRNLLFGVEAWDLPTLIAVSFALAVCALSAGYLPARRAASVDPAETLRAE